PYISVSAPNCNAYPGRWVRGLAPCGNSKWPGPRICFEKVRLLVAGNSEPSAQKLAPRTRGPELAKTPLAYSPQSESRKCQPGRSDQTRKKLFRCGLAG